MSTDLARTKDHPAVLLEAIAEERKRHLSSGLSPEIIEDAAKHLRGYEQTHGVTFATLSNDALAGVREAYHAFVEGASHSTGYPQRASDLASAVCDLLGLGD